MKKLKLFLASTLFIGGLFFAQMALAQEKIDSFDVTIKINQDNSINITEKIIYDFGDLQRHGIYRDIPYIYGGGLTSRHTDISEISITDGNDRAYYFEVSNFNKNKRIKIGQEDTLVSGLKIYVISYRVDKPFIFAKDKNKFYWDIIGGAWTVPVIKSTATIWLPQTMANGSVQAKCYAGEFKSEKSCDTLSYLFENNDTSRVTGVVFQQSDLSAGGILTVLLDMPVGTITAPSQQERTKEFLQNNIFIFLPFIVLVVMFLLWRRFGRDPKGRGNIIVQYDVPDNLSPAEVGTIVDEKAHKKDISAEIIFLAIRGYLKITRLKKPGMFGESSDYLLEKFKDENDLPNDFQKELMANIFAKATNAKEFLDYKFTMDSKTTVAVLLSDLNKAYKWRPIVEKGIYKSVVDKAYFVKNPNKIRTIYISVLFFGWGLVHLLVKNLFDLNFDSFLAYLSIVISLIITAVFGYFMPRRTMKGVLAKEYILGLKQYLTVAEKDRLNFHNAPEKNPEHFEALLPYAMVLGVEKKWAKQFEGIYQENSAWCAGFYVGTFNANAFSSSLDSFGSQASSTFSTPSGGGGGFAGGGGGGGGGGSW